MNKNRLNLLCITILAIPSLSHAGSGDNRLVGFAVLPADTFAKGPVSGQDDGSGNLINFNGRMAPFPGQPIQGFSGVQFAPHRKGAFWFLSDNGFGSKANSTDYLLRIYQARPGFVTERIGARSMVGPYLPHYVDRDSGGLAIDGFIGLRDPNRRIPFPIQRERSRKRFLTGSDFDIESFVIDSSDDIWVGEEFGPFLLKFDDDGVLKAAPIETPDIANGQLHPTAKVRGPDNPLLMPNEQTNLPRSRGFEGMAFSPDRTYLYPVLEGTVDGDPQASVRIYKFDTRQSCYDSFVGFYQMESASHAIGDMTPVNEDEFLIIERDNQQGAAATFKKIFIIDFSRRDSNGFVAKRELVDLLNILDPRDLNRDGSKIYSMPYFTIEDVLVIDRRTILVANDNNYPFTQGRPPLIDTNEVILVRLSERLDLDRRLGAQDN